MIRGLARGCTNLVGCGLMLVLVAAMLYFAAPTLARYVPRDITLVQSSIAKFEAKMRADHIGPAVSLASSWIPPTAADCGWGETTLAADSQLDLQGAVNYTQWAAYYHETSGWWLTAGRQLQGLCGAAPEPTAGACFVTVSHFETAFEAHSTAAQNGAAQGVPDNTPADVARNQQWMSNYTRLERIFKGTGCGK